MTVPGADPSGTVFRRLSGTDEPIAFPESPFTPRIKPLPNAESCGIRCAAQQYRPISHSGVGIATGPGTQSVSLSLMKAVAVTERIHLSVGAQAANAFNHANYATPNTTYNTAAFGTISNVQSAEGAGPRTIQATARFTF